MEIISTKLASVLVLVAIGLYVLRSMLLKSRDTRSPLDMEDLLLERGPDGKKQLSKVAALAFGSFLVTSWVLVNKAMAGDNIDALFNGYLLAWVAPILGRVLKNGGTHTVTPPETKT